MAERMERLSSVGPEVVERRLEGQEESASSAENEDIWGYYLYEFQHSENREFLNTVYGNDGSQERMDGLRIRYQKDLRVIAETRPDQFEDLLREVFLKTSDLETFLQQFDFDYKDNEEFEAMVDERMEFLAEENGAVSDRAAVRHREMAIEAADIISGRFFYDAEERFSGEVIDRIVFVHVQDAKEAQTKVLKNVETLMPRVKECLLTAINNGEIPLSKEVLEERLSILKVRVVDDMFCALNEQWGDFDAQNATIRVGSSIPEAKVEDTLMHETLHAVSGQAEVMQISDEFEDVEISMPVIKRIGFSLFNEGKSGKMIYLNWLNEAVTESMTMDLLDIDEGSYDRERMVLKLLEKIGVSRDLILGAYFENYTKTEPGERPSPALRKLFTATNEQFGGGFLMKLDRYLRDNTSESRDGLVSKEALAGLEKNKDRLADFISSLNPDRPALEK